MKLLLPVLVVVSLLAGCATPKAAMQESAKAPSSIPSPGGSASIVTPTPFVPVQLFNDTLAFVYEGGGSAGSATFTVPARAGNLTFTVEMWGNCPGGYAKGPQVQATPPGGDAKTVGGSIADFLAPVPNPSGYDPYGCSLNASTSGVQQGFGMVRTTLPAKAGTWALATAGEFTGTVRVAVTAQP